MQGRTKEAVRQVLTRPETARAVHRVVHLFAGAVPQFKKLRIRDVADCLQGTAAKIALVNKCSARIRLFPGGADVTAASNGFQVFQI